MSIKLGAIVLYFGNYDSSTPALSGYTGFNELVAPRKLDMLGFMTQINKDPVLKPDWGTWAASLGASLLCTTAPNTTTLNAFAAGTYDSAGLYNNAGLDGLAAACVTYGKPMIIRLAHEFNGNWASVYGNGYETAAQFIAGWRHIVTRFRSQGATNVLWMWAPNVWGSPGSPVVDPTDWYPGDEYVDYVGLDGYHNTGDAVLESASDLFGPSHSALKIIAPTKPFAVAEFGCAADSRLDVFIGGKAGWYDDLFSWVASIDNCFLVTTWEQPGNSINPNDDWTINSSGADPAALDAFRANVQAPPFTQGLAGAFSLGPGGV